MKSAIISECGKYRYCLSRVLDLESPNRLLFIMLNPSVADAQIDDNTIRRCISFAKRLDYGFLEVVNCYAFRATDPKDLYKEPDSFGPENVDWLRECIKRSDAVICAWGDNWVDPKIKFLIGTMLDLYKVNAYSLGELTKKGNPRHPLYQPTDCKILPYKPGATMIRLDYSASGLPTEVLNGT